MCKVTADCSVCKYVCVCMRGVTVEVDGCDSDGMGVTVESEVTCSASNKLILLKLQPNIQWQILI